MDVRRFDDWTQLLGGSMPRRAALGAVLALVVGRGGDMSARDRKKRSRQGKDKRKGKSGSAKATRLITVKGKALCGLAWPSAPYACSSVRLTVPAYSKTVTPSRNLLMPWTIGDFTFTGVPANARGSLYRSFGYGSCTSSVSTGNPFWGTTNLNVPVCRK